MATSLFLPSASRTPLQRPRSADSDPGISQADVIPLENLNSTAAKEIYSCLGENDIRLVVVQAGKHSDPIRCTLTACSLDALPLYEALSYVWGSQANPKTIELDGRALFITQNLHEALVRIRKPAEDRIVWIDALAINQSDVPERNLQVRKMLKIYKRAQYVLAWIGQGTEDPDHPLAILGSPHGLKIPDWDCIFGQMDERKSAGHFPQQLFTLKYLDTYEFWSRAWIIQEITQSNVIYMLGPYEISHEHLFCIWWQVLATQSRFYDVEAGEDPAKAALFIGRRLSAIMSTTNRVFGPDRLGFSLSAIMLTVNRVVGPERLGLRSWLKSFILMHEPRCLDPHDVVYAFYNLFTPEIQKIISIDYSMPVADLFALMTKLYIEATGNLWILSFVEISSRYSGVAPALDDAELPTWAFNFAGRMWHFWRWHEPICKKGVQESKAQMFYHRFEKSSKLLLYVKGVSIGQVHEVDRSPRHKFFLGTSFLISECCLGIASNEDDTFLSAFLRPFAEPADFSSLLLYDLPSMEALDGKYCHKYWAAVLSHHERVMFSYIPKRTHGQFNERFPQRQFALGHPGVLVGDKVCLILGCPVPLLLRKSGDSYRVIGSAYAQGYMEGEAMDALGMNIDELEDFCLC